MKILFLCEGNSARSQMAEGLARYLLKGKIEVQSACAKPTNVSPLAVKVLAEIGIDISGSASKSFTDLDVSNLDLVITLCEERACLVHPEATRRLYWLIPDPTLTRGPEEVQLQAFRWARDEIKQRLLALEECVDD